MSLSFHANGKLLLSGEYFVLDGAKAIGLPCRFGQSLEVSAHEASDLIFWKSKSTDQTVWFEGIFRKSDFSIVEISDPKTGTTLQHILQQARLLNPNFLTGDNALAVETKLDFPRLWGLGTSSTLIYNLAKWSQVDPFQLSASTLGGSGYDIACAGVDTSILYQIKAGQPTFETVVFDPPFKESLYFVYLSKKQNSREGIQRYREKARNNIKHISEISNLSAAFLTAKTLTDFQKIMLTHEQIVSEAIALPRAQDLFFSDFEGVIKSLGAWGGDFALVATTLEPSELRSYFNKKGFDTLLSYKEMVKT